MPHALSRRQRRMLTTATFSLIFVAAAIAIVFVTTRSEPTYRPGEAVEGLTADLDRSVPGDYPRITFTDVTDRSGITFRHFSGHRTTQLPEDMGSGAAWADYDNDGWLDLFVVNQAGPLTLSADEVRSSSARSALYRNNGDGTFTDVSASAGIDYRSHGMGAAWGDYDNDGWPDLVVSSYGENELFRNNGDGTFERRSEQSGIGAYQGFWTGVSWGDFDRDGLLDLYVAGYVKYSDLGKMPPSLQYDVEAPPSLNPSAFAPERNLLYRNNGDGTFTEMAYQAGVANPRGRSLAAAWVDLDDDGWPDLYVANDVSDNALFRNLGNGLFEEVSLAARVADYRGAMGIAVGDWDGDADVDLFITHWIAQENALYNNMRTQRLELDLPRSRTLQFMDEADRYGLGQIALDYVGWGTSFFDYDNDGSLDLFVVNGSTLQEDDDPRLLVGMRDQLFWNRNAEEGFYDVSAVSGQYFATESVGRGAAFGDYDNDGDTDVFVVNNGGRAVLLRNDGGNTNRWLKIRLEGRQSNRSAIGAKLRLVAGPTVQIREVGSQSSYLSQNSLIAHFGLGSRAQADTLEIVWPSGLREILTNVAADQTLHLVEGTSTR
ncbi:MAG: CRTAC1 family protein [Gemmatimonadetes bacterium]|nr:CRTAC1 family protein [Gemmatimonadota bacterium]